MARRNFLTVPDELLDYAERISAHFEALGYTVEVEQSEIEFPYTPTAVCRRGATTVFLEVDAQARMDRLEEWSRYAHSCQADTRVAVAVPDSATVPAAAERKLSDLGIGVYTVFLDHVVEKMPPKDQAVNVQLPGLDTLSAHLRQVLGPVYEEFNRAQWREGFEDACQALEVEARRYLIAGINNGRITFVDAKGRTKTVGEKDVEKMTMGQLAKTFGSIQNQNKADSQIGSVLSTINADRVGVAHHKASPRTESKLRQTVGRHMWKIFSALKILLQ